MKQGYTFYPKDWNTSEAVFELNLQERGLYRELIDLAMLNDNKVEIKLALWTRKFNTDINTLKTILSRLEALKLITTSEYLFIPSCENRLNIIRGGSKGGKISSKNKAIDKPIVKPTINQNKINKNKVNYNSDEFKLELSTYFKEKATENELEYNKVIKQVKEAYEYYKELNFHNSNGKKILNLKTTIWNNWINKDLEKFKLVDKSNLVSLMRQNKNY